MHDLPDSWHPVFLDVASYRAWVYQRPASLSTDRRRGKRLWAAISAGELDAVMDCADQAALNVRDAEGRLPIQALDAFDKLDAAIATVALVVNGSEFDVNDAVFLDRFDLGLIALGFQCGPGDEDAVVGMHMLPRELYPAYRSAAQRWQQASFAHRSEAVAEAAAAPI